MRETVSCPGCPVHRSRPSLENPQVFSSSRTLMLTSHGTKYQPKVETAEHATEPPTKGTLATRQYRSALGLDSHRGPVLKLFVSILTTSSPFDSLFRVLFIFRSRYLFAIGLRVIFRFRRNSSPILRHKSQSARLDDRTTYSSIRSQPFYGAVTLSGALFQRTLTGRLPDVPSKAHNSGQPTEAQIFTLTFSRFTRRY